MKILVGTTIPAFAMETPDWGWWIHNREQITAAAAAAGHHVEWLAVLQIDARGLAPFRRLIDSNADTITYHQFSLDLDVDEWDGGTRLAGIITGRNLIVDHALRTGADWIYFADSDIEAPDDLLPRLLELRWPVVGAHVPTYCLDGPRIPWIVGEDRYLFTAPPGSDVRKHWNTAGSLLVRRDVFRRVPWRMDPDAGETDDPATQAEMARIGWPTLVRHDVICRHHPEAIGGFEQRKIDRKVYR